MFDLFNFDYALEKMRHFFSNFDLKQSSNLVQILITIIIALFVWKFIKNIIFAIMFAVLAFIVYQSYLNVPEESKTMGNENTQIDIKTNGENVVSSDVKKLINDILEKTRSK